ncbi:MAG: hypothetical protein H6825_11690 [Planctomycetes bacterium]|nr:hypothetical protein [Planctomycetota bacterium]
MGACAIVLLVLAAALPPGDGLVNGDFETKGGKSDPVPGWTLSVGARNGGDAPLSEVELDGKTKHGGKRALHVSARNTTLAFQIVQQDVAVRLGGHYRLTGFARTDDVRRETNVKGIAQFDNCYLALFAYDGLGELCGRQIAFPDRSQHDWQALTLDFDAPQTARRIAVTMFLSVSGDLWFDDLALEIEGGDEVPEPALVFEEDFEGLDALPPAWLVEEGARNGGTEPVSETTVDRHEGAGRSRRSLRLSGDRHTILWNGVDRFFAADPGDVFEFTGTVSAKDVHQEVNTLGIQQFANLHARLVFFDESGATVGAPRFAQPGSGTFDWTPLELRAVAPEGAVRGMLGLFLSMSGTAWFDDLRLTRQVGGRPAYADWLLHETGHLVMRYPPDHPFAPRIDEIGARFEEAALRICAALDVDPGAPVTMFLYRDDAQGQALTGRDLAYAEPERRAVHQGPNNTIGHELVHVYALGLGYARTALLGEGLGVWLDGASDDDHHARAADLLRKGELPTLDALLDDFRAQAAGYPAAGSFCGYVIATYGMDAFRRLYPLGDLRAAAPSVLGADLADVDGQWRKFLADRFPGDG